MYFATLNNTGSGFTAAIWRNVNGVWTNLANGVATTGSGVLRFEVVGTSLKVFLNNTLVAFAHDSMITGPGTIGIRATSGTMLDNVDATALVRVDQTRPFTENFDTAVNQQLSIAAWLERAGNFRIASGVAQGNAGLNLATVNGLVATDVDVQANVSVTVPGQVAGLVARYSGPADQNMYYATLSNTGSGFVAALWRNVNGAWTQLASAATGSSSGTLLFRLAGSQLRLFLNGNLLVSAADTALTTGGVGIRTTQGAVVDNFSVV
jgi:hypothetical protein